MNCVIYARYSSDNQTENSIEVGNFVSAKPLPKIRESLWQELILIAL